MDNLTFFGLLAGLAISSLLVLGCGYLAVTEDDKPLRLLLLAALGAWFLTVAYACGAALLGVDV